MGKVVSKFRSNEELLDWIQASCSWAWNGVVIDNVSHWDGCCCGSWAERSEQLPTILSSVVFMKGAEVCPEQTGMGLHSGNFRIDWRSICAGWDCCFMFDPDRMKL